MRVTFFGSLAEAIGRKIELPVESGATAGAVRRQLMALYPHAAAALHRPAVRACVDDVIVEDGHDARPGSTPDFLPPLSGG